VVWDTDGSVSTGQKWANAWPGNGVPVAWALTFDNGTNLAELFINGLSKGVLTVSPATDWGATPGNFEIGSDRGTVSPFDGKIAHVAVFESLLSSSSIALLARIGLGRLGGRDWGLVTVLPTGATVGDTCAYVADNTNGVVWNLIYDGQGSYPWKYLGGPPLAAYAAAAVTTASTTYATPTSGQLTMSLPLAGDYDIWGEAFLHHGTAAAQFAWSYAVGALAASDNWGARSASNTAIDELFAAPVYRHTGRSANDSVAEKVKTNVGTATYGSPRALRAQPVRVG
jgi:hypothetical protein